MIPAYHPLRVAEITRRAGDAVSLTFEVPASLREHYRYRPGQHLNLRLRLEGAEVRRSYSLHGCPVLGEPPMITVRRVPGGRASNAINDALRVGDTVEATPPTGSFGPDLDPAAYRQYVLVGAGSGITPLYSILRSVLHAERHSFVDLLYGNRSRSTALFADDLDALRDRFPHRLRVQHTFSRPGWSSLWRPGRGAWHGRIEGPLLRRFVDAYPPRAQTTEYYVCGPGAMNTAVRDELVRLGVPPPLVHVEHYGLPAATTEAPPTIGTVDACLVAHLHGRRAEVRVPAGDTVLDALRREGYDPPYSCESGVCSTCKARVTRGAVQMRASMALSESEIDRGYALTCQALPTTESVEVTYEVPR